MKSNLSLLLPRAADRLQIFTVLLLAFSLFLSPALVQAAPQPERLAQADEPQWLIMIYSDADDNILEEDLLIDLQEAELVGSTDQVTIVVQSDRFQGGYDAMGDWTGAKRFLITQDSDMSRIGSQELEDLGEVNMADGQTLKDFIEWAVTNFPAQKRMLILSDHGSGWPGGFSDPDPGGRGPHDVALADGMDDNLWLMELDQVLDEVRSDLGLDYFDVIGFDACLMSQLEVYTALAPHALYSVASQELEPGLGWAYAGFLDRLTSNPDMEGDELVTQIVATYIDEDMRLEDPSYVGTLTRQQAVEAISPDITLTGVDLTQIATLNMALDNFVATLETLDQDIVAQARAYAQAYESVFGDELPSPYIDLGHFVLLVQSNTDDPAVQAAALELEAARQAVVIAEKHGPERPGSTGVAIYFPVREMYKILDNFGYTQVASRFAEESQWDEFLAFHSGDTGSGSFSRPASSLESALQTLIPDVDAESLQMLAGEIAAMMEQGLTEDEIAFFLVDDYALPDDVVIALVDNGLLVGASAAGEPVANTSQRKPLQIAPITLSDEVAYPGEPVSVDTEITGERIGYVYSFIGRFLPEDDILIIEDEDFLFADEDTSVGGVTYPLWPEGSFAVGFDWEPFVYAISDGTTSIRTLFSPETYGEAPIYTVEGIYSFADGSPERYARLFFRDGELAQVFGFTGANNNGVGAPSEITPQLGDQFTVLEQGYYLSDDAEDDFYSGESGTLTFGEETFFIEETPAPSGNYVVGVLAEDLDGNLVESYESLFVVGEDDVTEEGFVPLVDEYLGFALLHPETWVPLEDSEMPEDRIILTDADEIAEMSISVFEYADAANAVEANLASLESVLAEYEASDFVTNLTVDGEPEDYSLGLYDAQLIDFSFDSDGVTYWGEVVASTPIPGQTYVVDFFAPDEAADYLLPDLDAVLYSFDILFSSVDYAKSEAPQPEYAEVGFIDEYSDPFSGLYDDEVEQEWGLGYYDLEAEQYIYVMNPASGVIYDYYVDLALPDEFMLQVSSQTAGAEDTGYGLIFQVQDDNHFYAFRVSGDGYFLVEKADGEYLDTLVDWTVADLLDLTEDALNTLAVAGYGSDYFLYVNGVQVGGFSDDSYGEGSAGYMIENFDETAPAAFGFDDFVVGVPAE